MSDFLVPLRSVPVGRPCTLEDTVPAGHLARFVWTILESVDFTPAEELYESVAGGPGRPPYHPRVLMALWVYGMTRGLETAAEIAGACTVRDDFRWIAGGLFPCDQTLLNFLSLVEDCLPSLWTDVLKEMHRAGHIDLSALAEDGTKLRANASPRSFHTGDQIAEVIEGLKTRLAQKLREVLPQDQVKPHQIQVRALKERLGRAERAAAELQARLERRSGEHGDAPNRPTRGPRERATGKFGRSRFKRDGDRNVMICPAGQELAFVGEYSDDGRLPYRLYGKTDCGGCTLKPQCTQAAGRRLKIPVDPAPRQFPSPPAPAEAPPTPSPFEDAPAPSSPPPVQEPSPTQFDLQDFRHEAQRDVMICPAGLELLAIGTYSDDGCHAYRLYERADCSGCLLKARCTKAAGRRLKVRIGSQNGHGNANSAEAASPPPVVSSKGDSDEHETALPQASLTDPEAVLMLATSQKRFEPSYNADVTVTRHGVIVSQFLTKNPTDFPNFRRALPSVLATLGHPDAWIGDGHYGSLANLRLADQAGVLLYASPAAGGAPAPGDKFPASAFRHDPAKDVLVCPAGRELAKVGTYDTSDRPYDLFARRDCADCPLKPQCTDAPGRRVKRPHHLPLIEALEARMKEVGDRVMRFRGSTVEPVNGQLKQHGLGRFHVRGLARCGVVLTLACMGHNLMKWKAREDARILKLAA